MAFGTPYTIGQAQSTVSSLTYTVPVTTTTSAHDSIQLAATGTSTTVAVSMIDSQGNTYVLESSFGSSTTQGIALFTCADAAVPLVSGTDSFTVTWSAANANDKAFWAVGVSGAGAVDLVPAITSSTASTNPTIASGTLNHASEILFAFFNTGEIGGVPSAMSGGFTNLGTYTNGTFNYLTCGYQVVAATTSVTCGITTASAKYVAAMVTQQAASGTSPTPAAAAGTGVPVAPVPSAALNMTIQGV